MAYKIIATSRYGKEEVDITNSLKEAQNLRKEYQMAYGNEFSITIKNTSRK